MTVGQAAHQLIEIIKNKREEGVEDLGKKTKACN